MIMATMSQVKYIQITIECSGCPAQILNSVEDIQSALRIGANLCGLNILKEDCHQFSPHGITAYALLSESHISIHTWPEEGFALIDVLSCALFDVESLVKCFQDQLQASGTSLSSQVRKALQLSGSGRNLPPRSS